MKKRSLTKSFYLFPLVAVLCFSLDLNADAGNSQLSADCLQQIDNYGDGVHVVHLNPWCFTSAENSASASNKVIAGNVTWVGVSRFLFRKTVISGMRPIYEIIAGNSTQLSSISLIQLSDDGTKIHVKDSGRTLTFIVGRFGNVAPIKPVSVQ